MKMYYNADRCSVELSARTLCELSLDSGNLDSQRKSGLDSLEDEAGARDYQRIIAKDKSYGKILETLVNTSLCGGIYFTVTAKASRITSVDGVPRVDIIKNIKKARKKSFVPDIWTQSYLKILAYFIAVERDSDAVITRFIGFTGGGEESVFEKTYNMDQLRTFYVSLLEKAEPFARIAIKKELEVYPSLKNIRFPYSELREGQEIMIKQTYSAIKKSGKLFLQAPTGTGKTISSIFPAVKAIGDGYIERIFYLTAKSSTKKEAFSAAYKLFQSGAKLNTIVLNAKEQMCICPAKKIDRSLGVSVNRCNSFDCEYARGYYERSREAIAELLSCANGYTASLVMEVAKKYKICPYELSLDLSEYCEIIICDYNYAFDPSVYLRRYFDDERGKYAFLIDEAHNLAYRARDMYSAELCMSDFSRVTDAADAFAELDFVNSAGKAFLDLRALCKDNLVKNLDGSESGFYMNKAPLSKLDEAMEIFKQKSAKWLSANRDHPMYNTVSDLNSLVKKYLLVSEFFDKGFLSYVEINNFDIRAKMFCLAPSGIMKGLLSRARSSVFFSATLMPPEYFCDVLTGKDRVKSVDLPSSFPPENLCVAVFDGLSTRLEDRDSNVLAFARIIAATASRKSGNYIAYFPSYNSLEKVLEAFKKKYPAVETVVQKSGMTPREKDEFLQAFRSDGRLRIGFCVLGGAFAEGVDLPGARLIGAIIFGVGLPGLSNERNIVKEYFDAQIEQGYDYAYTYPGMNNVLQAVGRVIRTEEDRGVAVLVDDRYGTPQYRNLFPKHWNTVQYAGNARSLAEILRRFWESE